MWRIESDDYSNRAKKAKAYDILLQKYCENPTFATIEDLKRKINNLRTDFRNELRKIDISSESGAGTEDLYKSRVWFMETMMFIRDQETPAQSRGTLSNSDDNDTSDKQVIIQHRDDTREGTKERESKNSEGSLTVITRQLPMPMKQSSSSLSISLGRKGKSVTEVEKAKLLSLAKARLTEPEDRYLSQAKIWVHELKCFDATQELFAKKAINDKLFEAR